VYPSPQTYVITVIVDLFALTQFPSPSLMNPVSHLRDTVSIIQPPKPSE